MIKNILAVMIAGLVITLSFVVVALILTIPGAVLLGAIDFIGGTNYLSVTNAIVVGLVLAMMKTIMTHE